MRIFLVFAFSTMFAHGLSAQEPNLIPPNPETSALIKFEQVPVSLHSGLAEVSIPIYQLETKSLSIPISLIYHSRGIRVSEMASRVGLGWSLNAGGVVSRQIRDGADDHPMGYLNNQLGNFYNDVFTNNQTRMALLDQLSYGSPVHPDLVPDMFFYSFPKGSGKFIIDQLDGKIVQKKFTNDIITYKDKYGFNSFEIRDSEGNLYHFGKYGDTLAYSNIQTLFRDYITAPSNTYIRTNPTQDLIKDTWYLLRIITSSNEEITFEYDRETQNYNERLYDGRYSEVNVNNPPTVLPHNTIFSVVENKRSHIMQLKKIKYKNTTIEFISSLDARLDVTGGSALDKIKISQKINNQNIIIKEIELFHHYSTSSSDRSANINTYFLNDQKAKKRLFLNKIVFKNNKSILDNEDEYSEYAFTYDDTVLPSRFSNSVDRWGYFNNKQNGQFLIEEQTRPNKRNVDSEFSGAGLLKTIMLPTGGKQHLKYEQNIGFSNVPLSAITLSGGNQYLDVITRNLTLSEFDYDTSFNNGVYSESFIINYYGGSFNRIPVRLNSWVSPSNGCGSSSGPEPPSGYTEDCPFLISVQGGPNNIASYLAPGNRVLSLFPGTYTLKIIPNISNYDPTSMNESFYVNLSWDEMPAGTTSVNNFLIHGPGKRIKKTILESEIDSYEMEYIYENEDGIASGLIFGHPDYIFKQHRLGNYDLVRYNRQGENVQSSHSNEIGYEFVQTIKKTTDNSNKKIKTTYLYSNIPDTGEFYTFPFHSPTDNSWLRGHLLEQNNYEYTVSGFKPLQQVINKYKYGGNNNSNIFTPPTGLFKLDGQSDFGSSSDFPFLHSKNKKNATIPLFALKNYIDFWGLCEENNTLGCTPGEYYHMIVQGFKIYHFTGGTVDLVESKNIDYHENGLMVETTFKSEFDYMKNYNPKITKQFTSLGDTIKNIFYYPDELLQQGIQSLEMQSLVDSNRIGSPVRTETFHNEIKISDNITKYGFFPAENQTSHLLPKEVYSLKGVGAVSNFDVNNKKISYKYNTKGNIIEYTSENGISTSIIWGYDGKYPIVKVDGLSYTEILNLIGQNTLTNLMNTSNGDTTNCTGYSGCNEATFRTVLKNLRNSLNNAMVTTYTYDPLIGVTSITPPNGQTTYYEYDGFGRLKSVKDEAGNAVQDIQYHNRPQP